MSPEEIKAKADAAEGLASDAIDVADPEEELLFDLESSKPTRGRPRSYSEAFCSQAEKLCKLGATDVELADFFEVSVRTLYRWKAQFEDFCQALKSGKESADERVERSLYHKAVGYTHNAVKIFMPAGAKEAVYAPYREHVPPDTTACIFWLKNRRAEAWRDKQEIDFGALGDFSEPELRELSVAIRALKARGAGAPAGSGTEEKTRH